MAARRRERGAESALKTDCFATCDASWKAADFFICFERNPLKSLDSTKKIQINPRIFIWIYLDFIALSSRPGCRSRVTRSLDARVLPALTLSLHRRGGTDVSLLAIDAPVA